VTDQTLPLADYAMDVSRHPQMTLEGKKWAAVIADMHYQPFLKKRFPDGRWHALGNRYLPAGGIMMAIIPVTPRHQRDLERWCDANRAFHSVTREIVQSGSNPVPVLAKLSKVYSFVEGDPFLESVYWHKCLDLEKKRGDRTASLRAIHQGLQRGYALPFFFNDEGVLLMQEGRYKEARKAFRRALGSELNLTPARSNLELLEK
jgi:hypothetical protein